MNIIEALQELDPLNEDHWTGDGAPRIDAVGKIMGDFKITRKDIIDAAPKFDRGHPIEEKREKKEEKEKTVIFREATDEEYDPRADVEDFSETLKGVTGENASDLVEEVRKELETTQKELNVAQMRARAVRKMLDLAKNHASLVDPDINNGNAIRNYIDSQNKARAERAERRNKLFKGITPKDIQEAIGKSPLDAAMSHRKPALGSKRPTRI